jgi:hypothetical protein
MLNTFKTKACKTIKEWSKITLRTFATILATLLVLVVGPTVEGKIYPVINDTSIISIEDKGKYLEVVWKGDKGRDCRIDNVAALVRVHGSYVVGKISNNEDTVLTPRTLGDNQTFGPWKITPAGSALILTASHRCHFVWETVTPLLRWDSGQP